MGNNIMNQSNKSCTGCAACSVVCPQNAIVIKMNSIGFFSAEVDAIKCSNCGLCKKVCFRFSNSNSNTSDNISEKKFYALQSSNEQIVKNCSSGGIAHVIEEMFVSMGGKAVGAIYDYNDNSVKHEIIDNIDDLILLDGSKYLQSNPELAFNSLISELTSSKNLTAVVVGTPCQILGLDRVLKKNNLRNRVLLVEFFCHGVPSYLLWNEEVNRIEKKLGTRKFEFICFRDKIFSWHHFCLRVSTNNRCYYGHRETDLFWQVFFENVLLSDACFSCEARKEKSVADIRIGDYWGKKFQKRDDGVSVVFAISKRGEQCIEKLIESKMVTILESDYVENTLSPQSISGYGNRKLHDETFEVLRQTNDVMQSIKYYRKHLSLRDKKKRITLALVAIIPVSVRLKLKKMR